MKNHIRTFLIIALLIATALGCRNPLVPKTGIIKGTVKISDGFFVSGAKVSIGSISVTTDVSGQYSMEADTGDYKVTASKIGYLSVSKNVSVLESGFVSCKNKDVIVDFSMTPGGGNTEIDGIKYYLTTSLSADLMPITGTDSGGNYMNATITLNSENLQSIPTALNMETVQFVNGSKIFETSFDEQYTIRKDNKLSKAVKVPYYSIPDNGNREVDVVVKLSYNNGVYYLTALKQSILVI